MVRHGRYGVANSASGCGRLLATWSDSSTANGNILQYGTTRQTQREQTDAKGARRSKRNGMQGGTSKNTWVTAYYKRVTCAARGPRHAGRTRGTEPVRRAQRWLLKSRTIHKSPCSHATQMQSQIRRISIAGSIATTSKSRTAVYS